MPERRDGETVERWRYIDGWVDSSFVGILPAERHEARDVILIHRPAGAGGPHMPERPEWTYADLMPQVLDYLAIPPDRPAPAGRAAMRLVDSPVVRSVVRVPPTIRIDELLAATGGRLDRTDLGHLRQRGQRRLPPRDSRQLLRRPSR